MNSPAPITAEQMRLVLDVSRALVVTADLEQLLRRIAEAATSLLGAERASIFLHDRVSGELWTKIALGAAQIRVPDHAGIVGHVFQSNAHLNIPDAYSDSRFNRAVDLKSGFVTRNLLTIPLPDIQGRPLGVLQVVNKIGGTFLSNDEEMAELLADQAGVALQRYHLQQAAVESVELKREMELARKVQERLIPQHPPGVVQFDAVGWTLPASTTGGDCYDLWKMTGGQLGIFLGDASGHGLAPALVVSQARTLIRALSEINCDPKWLLTRVNARLTSDLESDRFVTAFAACLTTDGRLNWWSAGHGGVFVRTGPDDELIELDPCAPPLGVMDELEGDLVEPIHLEVGGQLIALTDGITEAPSLDLVDTRSRPEGSMFGAARVREILNRCRCQSPADTLLCFRDEMKKWQGKEEPVDDQTVVIVQRIA